MKYTGSFSLVSFDALDLYFEFLSPLFIFPRATLLNEILLTGGLTGLLILLFCLTTFGLAIGLVFFTSGALVSFWVALGFLALTLYTALVDFFSVSFFLALATALLLVFLFVEIFCGFFALELLFLVEIS